MKDSNYIKVFTGNFIIIQRIIIDLKQQNIPYLIKDETESGRLAGFGAAIPGEQELFVKKENEALALSIIKSNIE